MVIHPSDMHFIWAVGRTIVIKSIEREQNTYLKGHEGRICQIAVSKSGALLATGEQMGPGEVSAVIVWDFDARDMLYRVRYHNESIQALSFSCDEQNLVSLGGIKDGNQLVVWNMAEGRSEANSPASNQLQQECQDVKFLNTVGNKFVTVHNNAIKFWTLDRDKGRLAVVDC